MTPSSNVRVRVAPSPTGEPHVGTAYTALFNYLLAKITGGKFILRIEDTDSKRSTPESESAVIKSLKWCGLNWDEGPDIGGEYGPYRQSERKHIYKPYVKDLLDKNYAFRCFCSAERLEEMRKLQRKNNMPSKYDGCCLKLSDQTIDGFLKDNKPHVIRLKIPDQGSCKFKDGIYGDMEIPWNSIDMQVLLKSDGMPTYHLANVVDDHLMKITHVARGEEWISSVPKHILIYQYLKLPIPEFIHLPLLRNPDKSKLSKRKNPTSISYYSATGYIPEALINFLGIFFIQTGENDEIMDLKELIERFNLNKLPKSGAVFDGQKLNWLNGRWIRERLSSEQFMNRVSEWINEEDRITRSLKLSQSRITTFSAIPAIMDFMFKSDLNITESSFENNSITPEETLNIIKLSQIELEGIKIWKRENIEIALRNVAQKLEKSLKLIVKPLFIAISGSKYSLPLFDSIEILGRAVVNYRIRNAIKLVSLLVQNNKKEKNEKSIS
ncbi:glutamate--tRNA ligase [Candidatus Liberibacter americanus]|uniref:Glutamate--tRNA ligase n=1 Tax=Candidatus Liberibacter americanus str. Sao Paulo TaxID=1261131 RepID=U6B7Y9_9HYPH|nr:glutamate--tRNA ligase [Candidatus Liberibacter americanus]AHA27976.1 Glutamyl- and glutaminyl-tRNA synthetase [Candidatus Liberibacter americanus str. Sao Paulo]EMS35875.1 glutamyl-tRNA ligase [Candidatus Liberibacter americanus PW_SP]